MTMLEGLTKPMRDALNAIRAGGESTMKANTNTIKALIDRGLIEVAAIEQPQRWLLSPVGEMVYFNDEVLSTYQTTSFAPGQDVQYLHWHTNGYPWRFEWEAGQVERITKAFVFVKYPNGEVKQHVPKRLRHKPMPTLSAVIAEALIEAAALQSTDTSFEPYISEPRMVDDKLIAVTAICNICGCQYDSIHLKGLRNPWLFANLNPRCPACLWPDIDDRIKKIRESEALSHDEPLVVEPRMVNDKLIAVTGFCDVCGCQYDDIVPYEMPRERLWRWTNLVSRCSVCFRNNCYECGKPLPATSDERSIGYCDECNTRPLGSKKAAEQIPNIPTAAHIDYPLLVTFLADGENAFHHLWAWYAGVISIALMDYERVSSEDAMKRAMRSAAALLHLRFEEEYLRLVDAVGHNNDADALFHVLPINAEMTVRTWMIEYGQFDYTAQLIDLRQTAREHAVYVDPIPTRLTPLEYREGQYSSRQRAGVCRVWWHAPSTRRFVEHVTQDSSTGRWYVHAHKLEIPIPLIPDEYFTVEELTPARINDRVQRLDDGQLGTVVGVSGGDVWVKPEQGGEQPRWKRVHVDIIYPKDPTGDETDEYLSDEAVPPPWTPDILKRVRIKAGLHAGIIAQVTDIGANARGATYKVFSEWYNASDLEDPNTPMTLLSDEEIAHTCAKIRLHLHGGMRVGLIESVTHLLDQQYQVKFVHFTDYIPHAILERIEFLYMVDDHDRSSVLIGLDSPPLWRLSQSDEAREFQAVLDAAGIALQARFNAQNELIVFHPLEDVLERLCANVRKLAGVLAVDLGFNNNPCLAQVKLQKILEGATANG